MEPNSQEKVKAARGMPILGPRPHWGSARGGPLTFLSSKGMFAVTVKFFRHGTELARKGQSCPWNADLRPAPALGFCQGRSAHFFIVEGDVRRYSEIFQTWNRTRKKRSKLPVECRS